MLEDLLMYFAYVFVVLGFAVVFNQDPDNLVGWLALGVVVAANSNRRK